MKKNLYLIIILILMIFIVGCNNSLSNNDLTINQEKTIVVEVGDQIPLTNIYYGNTDVLTKVFGSVYASKAGEIIVNSPDGKYFIVVKEQKPELYTSSKQLLTVGEKTKIQTIISPVTMNQYVEYEVDDNTILSVSNDGTVSALKTGVTTVRIISKQYNIANELTYIVQDEDEKYYEALVNMIVSDNQISVNGYNGMFDGIINYNKYSLVGISSYYTFNNTIKDKDFGSGIIYKMNIQYYDGTIKENVTTIQNETNIRQFEYYVITNRHLLEKKNKVKIYLGNDYDEIDATIIEYDDKIDLAVLKFTSKYYFPIAKIGDSDNIEKGDFIISIGNGTGKEYFRSNTFGVISGTKRYVATDTNGDQQNDWDSEYIQHDASINECDSGGAIMNLKGEIIGINSTKISSTTYNNMSFAIPINLVMEIVSQLEKGIRPQRSTLGVTIVDIQNYWQNPDAYASSIVITIPQTLKYGFYVTAVSDGGVAQKANVQVNDIIVKFNDIDLKYSYQIRAELGKYLIGSGQKATITVIRDGQELVLSVVF